MFGIMHVEIIFEYTVQDELTFFVTIVYALSNNRARLECNGTTGITCEAFIQALDLTTAAHVSTSSSSKGRIPGGVPSDGAVALLA